MVEKVKFVIDSIKLVEENPNSNFSILSLDFFASGPNLHDMYVSEDTLMRTANTIKNCPIVWKYSTMMDDATTHEKDESPVGFIPEKAEITSKKLGDGRTMLSTCAFVWRRFSGRLLEIFERDGDKPVSVEMSVLKSAKRSDGLLELLDFFYEAVTVLGSLVKPAVPSAQAVVLQFAKEYEEDFKKEFSDKYSEVDLSVLAEIKTNCQMGLDLAKQHNKSSSSVSLALARHMLKSEKASPEKIRHMAKVHKSNKFMDMQKDPPSENYISYMLYGGDHGKKWSVELSEKLDQIDQRHVSYFEKENFGDSDPKKEELPVEDEKQKVEEMAVEEAPKEEEEESPEEEKTETPEKEKQEEDKEKKENPKEEKDEKPEEEKKEEKKERNMSLDSNVDLAFLMKLLENQTEERKAYIGEQFAKPDEEKDMFAVFNAMYSEMCKMSAEKEDMCGKMAKMAEDLEKAKSDNEAYMGQNKELKEFKAEVEMARFSAEVEMTLNEVADTMPKSEIETAREESKNFTIDNITAWKNGVKAKAFTFAKDKKPSDGIVRIGLPFTRTDYKQNDSPWKRQ